MAETRGLRMDLDTYVGTCFRFTLAHTQAGAYLIPHMFTPASTPASPQEPSREAELQRIATRGQQFAYRYLHRTAKALYARQAIIQYNKLFKVGQGASLSSSGFTGTLWGNGGTVFQGGWRRTAVGSKPLRLDATRARKCSTWGQGNGPQCMERLLRCQQSLPLR